MLSSLQKFSRVLILVSVLSILWSADSIIVVIQRGGWNSPLFHDTGVIAFLFPFFVLLSPRLACWIGLAVAVFEMLLLILIFIAIFISWADPLGVGVRVFGFVIGFLENTSAIFLYYLLRFSLFALVAALLLRELARAVPA